MSENPNKSPIPNAYWLETDRILAGEYPGAETEAEARSKIRAFLDSGFTFFIDLTEEHEPLEPYHHILNEEAARLGISAVHKRMPIMDVSVPTEDFMSDILDTIDEALDADHKIYIHCFGGVGRTGTVAGCYLAEQGFEGDEALVQLARLRAGIPKAGRKSPETAEQEEMVRNWESPDLTEEDLFRLANHPLEAAIESMADLHWNLASGMMDAVLVLITESSSDEAAEYTGFTLCRADDLDLTVMLAFTDKDLARDFAEENSKNMITLPARDFLTILFDQSEQQPEYDGILFNIGSTHSQVVPRELLYDVYQLMLLIDEQESLLDEDGDVAED